MNKTFVLAGLLAVSLTAHAETRYVTDQFKITMRSGSSTSNKILRMLPSGYALDVLQTDPASGYSQVRTADGSVGYVLTRQLQDNPSARSQLSSLRERLKELQQTPDKLSARLAELQEAHKKLQSEDTALRRDRDRLASQLDQLKRTSTEAIQTARERDDLRGKVQAQARQLDELNRENRELRYQSAKNWFMVGAGVIVLGILIGFLLPRLRLPQRRSGWGSL